MPRITEAELGRTTAFLAATSAGTPADPLPRTTLAGLRNLLGADEAEYFELRRADRAVLALAESHHFESAPGTEEALATYGYQNPLGWRRWRPADGPMRLSGRISRHALRRLDFYDAVMRPNGLTDILKVWLHSDSQSVACVQLWLRGTTFSERQEVLLDILQSHLMRLRAEAMAGLGVRQAERTLTRREAEVLTWAVRGEPDEDIAVRLRLSVATVGKHLEHAFAALGVHSRTEAMWRLAERMSSVGSGGKVQDASVVGSRGDAAR